MVVVTRGAGRCGYCARSRRGGRWSRRHRTRCLTASNPIAPSRRASWIAPRTWAEFRQQMVDLVRSGRAPEDLAREFEPSSQPKVLEEPQDLHILAGPGFAQPGLQEPPQPEKLVWQRPPGQRRRLIERARLALQQGQVVQRIEDQLLTPVAATMTGDLLTPADDHDDVHVALHHHVAVAVGGWHRVVVAAVAHQRQRRDPRRARVAGFIRDRRQRQQRGAVAREALPDRLGVPP